MILCDTNILIEIYRNNPSIDAIVNRIEHKNIAVSDVTRAELFVGTRNKYELHRLKKELNCFKVLPIQSPISSMSIDLLDRYCLSHKMTFNDALIAATAIYHKLELFTLNLKDFTFIPGLQLYRPS
jgi:predicted nucleic acid-binding protein